LFRPTLYKILWLFAPKRPKVITTQYGFKLLIIPRDRGVGFPLWIGHEFEPETVKIFQKHVKPGYIVFDIGANIGYFTMLASKLIGNSGKVVAFEPVPEFLEMLKFSANLNNFSNILPVQIALSDKPGDGIIYMDVENYGLASVSLNNVLKPKKKILNKFTTLDRFICKGK
jgi:FkbM family methyltransferase